jgi:2-oxoglutarate dehydrogenase E2 component (dihydrolipoamide succinyltransferase)
MAVELKVPAVGESISEVQIGQWLKAEGETAEKDENLVEIETDKATVEIAAPVSGTISKVLKRTGDTAAVGEIIGYIEPAGQRQAGQADQAQRDPAAAAKAQAAQSIHTPKSKSESAAKTSKQPEPRREADAAQPRHTGQSVPNQSAGQGEPRALVVPGQDRPAQNRPGQDRSAPVRTREMQKPKAPALAPAASGGREEEVVPMSPIRRRIAERLVEAQHQAALLTTFNEVDMSAVMTLRNEHKQVFLERYGIKLGFMSFFVKATIDALKLVPQVNAEIRGTDIIYHNYFDIGIAVGGGKGLVVPILRDADRMSFAEIELAIADLAHRARENSLHLEELQGGTFTISNGGVYGSMLSTPIVNPPQSGILGLHAIQDRPVAREGQVVVRPMMYLALTYDHRVVDGQGAVTFLKRIKDVVEEPMRMLVEI